MTKKHYIKIAAMFADNMPHGTLDYMLSPTTPVPNGAIEMWVNLRVRMSDLLREDNPRFDKERFYTACYGG